MGPFPVGYEWVARANVNKALPFKIRLLREGEDVWSWFQAAETTSQAAVPTEPEAALTLPGPMGSLELGETRQALRSGAKTHWG